MVIKKILYRNYILFFGNMSETKIIQRVSPARLSILEDGRYGCRIKWTEVVDKCVLLKIFVGIKI